MPPRAAWMLGRVVEALLVLGGCLAGVMCAGGCDSEPIEVRVESMTAEQWDAIDGAETILERPINISIGGRFYGRVALTWQEYAEKQDDGLFRVGYAPTDQFGCCREARSMADPQVIAHEIAHAFRIKHREGADELDDLMAPSDVRDSDGRPLFRDRDKFDRRADSFHRLCSAVGPP